MDLHLLQWNAGGLTTKFRELQNFLITNKIDIALIQETNFKSYHRPNWHIHGYQLFRKDRPAPVKGGGVCIYIRNTIPSKIKPSPDNMECITIQISTTTGPLDITNIYIP